MSDPKEESNTAVTSLSSTLVSSMATGFPEIAKASNGITDTIVNHFHFAPSPEAVPDRSYEELQAKVRDLETHLAAATTKREKWHCLMTYSICLAHGFNLSFPLPGS